MRRAAAFTFQAVAPGIIPAQRGEAENPLRIARMCNHYTIKIPGQEAFCIQAAPGQEAFCIQAALSPGNQFSRHFARKIVYAVLFSVSWIRQ